MRYLVILPILLFLVNCSENGLNFNLSEIEEDYSYIENPKERWEAYQLNNYSIDQTWACECIPPFGSKNFVIRGEIKEIEYNDTSNSKYGADYEYARTKVSTIDEAFNLIEEYEGKADTVIVSYHPKFGYPTSLKIDKSFMIADEEISYIFQGLKKIAIY